MTAPKLTKPQIAMLKMAARKEGLWASARIPAVQQLVDGGHLQPRDNIQIPTNCWRITQAGRDALEALG